VTARRTRLRRRWLPRRWILASIATGSLAFFVSAAPAGAAAPGDLDSAFGNGGISSTPVGPTATLSVNSTNDVVVQTDGKIVAVGSGEAGHLALVRLGPNGAPDPTFGTAGVVATAIGGADEALALQPDGKIVAAGGQSVARLNADGSLDDGGAGDSTPADEFGSGGVVVLPNQLHVRRLLVQPDGRIVVAGARFAVGETDKLTLARLLPDGTPDPAFGSGGVVAVSFGDSVSEVRIGGVALDGSGNVIVAGMFSTGGPFSGVLARFTAAGALDPLFGAGGLVILPTWWITDGSMQGANILVAGSVGGSLQPGARFTVGGSRDLAFGADGTLELLPRVSKFVSPTAIALDPDGKIVIAGGGFDPTVPGSQIGAARYSAEGFLDTGFGDCGIAVQPAPFGDVFVGGLAVQPDGKLVLAISPQSMSAAAVPQLRVARLLGGVGTEEIVPDVSTGPATGLTPTAATLTGTIDAHDSTVMWRFDIGVGTNYAAGVEGPDAGPGLVTVSASVNGLEPGRTYHYRLTAYSSKCGRAISGVDRTFTTPATQPSQQLQPTSSATTPAATLSATAAAGQPDMPPSGSLTVRRTRLGRALISGLRVALRASEAVTVRGLARISARDARRYGIGSRSKYVTVARGTTTLTAAGRAILTLRFTSTARRHLLAARRVAVALRIVLTDNTGHRTVLTSRLLLRR
jgi:uncharacterized delta-60 repeat protein